MIDSLKLNSSFSEMFPETLVNEFRRELITELNIIKTLSTYTYRIDIRPDISQPLILEKNKKEMVFYRINEKMFVQCSDFTYKIPPDDPICELVNSRIKKNSDSFLTDAERKLRQSTSLFKFVKKIQYPTNTPNAVLTLIDRTRENLNATGLTPEQVREIGPIFDCINDGNIISSDMKLASKLGQILSMYNYTDYQKAAIIALLIHNLLYKDDGTLQQEFVILFFDPQDSMSSNHHRFNALLFHNLYLNFTGYIALIETNNRKPITIDFMSKMDELENNGKDGEAFLNDNKAYLLSSRRYILIKLRYNIYLQLSNAKRIDINAKRIDIEKSLITNFLYKYPKMANLGIITFGTLAVVFITAAIFSGGTILPAVAAGTFLVGLTYYLTSIRHKKSFIGCNCTDFKGRFPWPQNISC